MLPKILGLMICLSWILMLVLTFVFLFKFYKTEDRKQIFLAAILAFCAVCGNFVPSIRGGYDNNHDFASLASTFDLSDGMFVYKEIAPIFIKTIIDIASSRNLNVILAFNRILPLLSLLIFYAGLRKAGAGKTGSLAGTCLLFFNFQAMISASSFSTTSIAVFIFITAIASLFNAISKEKIGTADIAWIFSSSILTAMTRIEHLPALAIIAAFLISSRIRQKDPIFYKKANIILFFIGIYCLVLCMTFQFSFAPQELLQKSHPFFNFNMHFIKENFAIMFSDMPANAFPDHLYRLGLGTFALAAFLLAALFPSGISWRKIPHIPAAIALTLAYFMCIYHWQDHYPLHFARHRMFMMVPMTALAAFSIKTISQLVINRIPRQKIIAITAVSLMLILYAAINVKTAYSLNGSLRNNDIEWQLLCNTQKKLKGKFNITTGINTKRNAFLLHYFGIPKKSSAPSLYYISADMITFSKKAKDFTGNEWTIPVITKTFYNSFHTTIKEESHAKILIRPGFYKIKKDSHEVQNKILQGILCLANGNYHCAGDKANELENLDISPRAHSFKLLAHIADKNETGIKKELAVLEENPFMLFYIDNVETAKKQLEKKPGLIKGTAKLAMSSDIYETLQTIWNVLSYEFDSSAI